MSLSASNYTYCVHSIITVTIRSLPAKDILLESPVLRILYLSVLSRGMRSSILLIHKTKESNFSDFCCFCITKLSLLL
jgi:hypothetical protein